MQPVWIQSLLYQPPTVLGKQLKPFSALHFLILNFYKSPFLHGKGRISTDDLILAVIVCASDFASRHDLLNIDIKRIKKWGREHRKTDLLEATATLKEYLQESMVIPEKWQSSGDDSGGTIKTNAGYALVMFAMGRLGMTEAEAWNAPLARLVCYRDVYYELETGKTDVVSDEESSIINGES